MTVAALVWTEMGGSVVGFVASDGNGDYNGMADENARVLDFQFTEGMANEDEWSILHSSILQSLL